MAADIQPFRLRLADGRLIENAGALQELIMEIHDKLPAVNSPEFASAKERYNKFAKFYNEKIMDVWNIYK